LNANKNENPFLNKPKKNQIKKKKDKSCRNFHERLSIDLDLNEVNDDQKEKKVVSSENEGAISNSKSSKVQKDIKDMEGKSSIKPTYNDKENKNNIKKNKTSYISSNNNDNGSSFENIIKANKENNNIINNNLIEGNNKKNNFDIKNVNNDNKVNTYYINNKKQKNNKNYNLSDYNKNEFNAKSPYSKNSRVKLNKRNEFIKNNSMKQFNPILMSNNYIAPNNDKKRKDLTISTKKILEKPKTFNLFSSEQIKNNNNGNNKIVFDSIAQRNYNKNYGYKNKKEQEIEIYGDPFNYLPNELSNKNRNKRNIRKNNLFNINGASMGDLQQKFKINEKKVKKKKIIKFLMTIKKKENNLEKKARYLLIQHQVDLY
jgi:hypothetical protein